MSLFNWMWDFGQDSKIEELTHRIEILEEWIRYYERTRQDQTCGENRSERDQTGQESEVGQRFWP